MSDKLKIMELIVVIVFGFVGQLGCWALMAIGTTLSTLENALVIHAIGAPIIFAILSVIYFTKFNYTTPLITAIVFLAVVVLLDFFVVALLINRSFDMFRSPLGTWLPFALNFTATYLTGYYITTKSKEASQGE